MGVQTLFMLVGDVAPTSWPPYVTVAASHGESFAAGSRAGLALDLASLLQFMMEMSKVCGLAGVLFVLKLPLATVETDIFGSQLNTPAAPTAMLSRVRS
jgi:hypothetical protein